MWPLEDCYQISLQVLKNTSRVSAVNEWNISTQERILASLSLCYVLASIQVRVLSVLCGE